MNRTGTGRNFKILFLRTLALIVAFVLVRPEIVLAQVTFQPSGCDFRVWFVTEPTITKVTVPAVDGMTLDTVIAELNPRLDDGYAHYFRAECTQVALGPMLQADLIENMTELARMNRLEDTKIWVEELPSGQMVGRVRASVNSGQRIYFLDIRRYLGENSLFDVWAGAEQYPTEGIVMFFKSVAYRGRLLNK